MSERKGDMLALEYFEQEHLELRLDGALMRALGADPEDTTTWPAGDFGYDGYDRSFELWGTRNDFEPTDAQLDAVWALGFQRGWICYQDGGEMYVTGHSRSERVHKPHICDDEKRIRRENSRALAIERAKVQQLTEDLELHSTASAHFRQKAASLLVRLETERAVRHRVEALAKKAVETMIGRVDGDVSDELAQLLGAVTTPDR